MSFFYQLDLPPGRSKTSREAPVHRLILLSIEVAPVPWWPQIKTGGLCGAHRPKAARMNVISSLICRRGIRRTAGTGSRCSGYPR